ncbi:MAG: asparagine synthase (glutamine-hydrolyzing) [Gammaproteobacteria bacterium]|jgi:asparagine synthase (glutamine-hydrolysing)
MCGIAGIVSQTHYEQAKDFVTSMLTSMQYRGPDDAGIFCNNPATLGHLRLSILDLSPLGHQPMLDKDHQFAIVYNGEIYNYREIRKELESKGIKFKSNTDTEVLLYAYKTWGESCLTKLNGMFAFAIWNVKEKSLFVARDRIGIKPLYYYWDGENFAFASEIKSLLTLPFITKNINYNSVLQYFIFRYNSNPETLFKNIYKLEPAHTLQIKNDKLIKTRYWRLNIAKQFENKNENEWVEELKSRLEKSVEQHLISDVPIGIFLSGGVDSNTIAALARNKLDYPIKTFSVGFSTEKGEDELDKINVSANYFNSEHYELLLKPNIEDILPKVIWSGDEPNGDPACVPTYLLSKLAAQHVKVVLSGEGGDELFGGYERSMLMNYGYKYLSWMPKFLCHGISQAFNVIPDCLLDKAFKYSSKLGKAGIKRLNDFMIHANNPLKAFIAANGVFDLDEIKSLINEEILSNTTLLNSDKLNNFYFYGTNKTNFLNHELRYEIETRLWADLLMKLDNSSMPFSLEGRVPFLDHSLVEFSARIPPHLKIKRGKEKVIFRKAIASYLPKEITNRKKDHFFVPIHKWLKNELKPFIESHISNNNTNDHNIFNSQYLNNIYKQYNNGQLFYARQLWNIVTFQIWYDIYFKNKFNYFYQTPIHTEVTTL